MKKCPYCAEEIQDEAIVCRYCGRDLVKPSIQSQTELKQPAVQTKKPSRPLLSRLVIAFSVAFVVCLLSILCASINSISQSSNKVKPTETAQQNSSIIMPSTATKTPESTRTPRPTSTPEYGTVDNPYPYGMEAPLYYKTSGQTSNFTFQVLNVLRGKDANDIVKNANQFNDDPPEGTSWMLIQVKVTLTDGAAYRLTNYGVSVISGGQIFGGLSNSVCCTKDAGFPELDANIALPGTSVDGWVIRPVLLTDEKPLLALGLNTYRPDLKDGVFFALHPN